MTSVRQAEAEQALVSCLMGASGRLGGAAVADHRRPLVTPHRSSATHLCRIEVQTADLAAEGGAWRRRFTRRGARGERTKGTRSETPSRRSSRWRS